MAKFTDYTQKTKPADADLLLIHDNAGAANKKTPFSGVWSWILDKLASAVISQLETTNKSIIPAINELNSNRLYGTSGSISVDVESRSGILIIGHPVIKDRNAMYFFCCSGDAGNLVTIIEPSDIVQVALEVTTLKITASGGTFNYRIYF